MKLQLASYSYYSYVPKNKGVCFHLALSFDTTNPEAAWDAEHANSLSIDHFQYHQ